MAILSFSNLRQAFGEVDIFMGLTASVPNNGRIGLVGPNGVGKTTLIRTLAGVTQPKEGQIHISKNTRVGYLRQEAVDAFADRENTVYEEMLLVFEPLRRQAERLREMEQQMQSDHSEALLAQYGQAQEAFELAGGYDYELRIQQVLDGLGFGEDQWQMPLAHCSGGQKTRALLARLLLERPELLVLDEPTNHLDVAALEWLENALRNWEGAMLLVSHDRYFLDRVVDTIWEMSHNGIESYRGNYTAYVNQREERWLRREEEFNSVMERFLSTLDFIKRNIARDSTRDQARGRMRRLVREVKAVEIGGVQALNQSWSRFMAESGGISKDKWNVPMLESRIKSLPSPAQYHQRITMRFQTTGYVADQVLKSKKLVIGYPNNVLFEMPDIICYSKDRIALIGPNGSGKSTFLRTLLGELEPLAGRLRLGSNLHIRYFSQGHEQLNEENTVLDELIAHSRLLPAQCRDYLAKFLFQGEDVFKPIHTLSGGERGRFALAILALRPTNFLVLDEPTNHLDILAQEVLEDALRHFEGTVLLVTHDRYLVDKLATQIWEIRVGELKIHEGDYQSYLARRASEREEAKAQRDVEKSDSRRSGSSEAEREARRLAKALAETEATIHQLEEDLAVLGQKLEAASKAQDWERLQSLGVEYKAMEAELAELMEQWEELAVAVA